MVDLSYALSFLSPVIELGALIGLAIYAKGTTRIVVVVAIVLRVIWTLLLFLILLRIWPGSRMLMQLITDVVLPVVVLLFTLTVILAVFLAIRDARVASRRSPVGQPSYPGFAGPTYPQQGYPPSGAPQPGQRRNP